MENKANLKKFEHSSNILNEIKSIVKIFKSSLCGAIFLSEKSLHFILAGTEICNATWILGSQPHE